MSQSIKEYFTRPHRQVYYPFDLGPSVLNVSGRKCTRNDFHILNKQAQKLAVSFFHSSEDKAENCVVYLHTHNGSKLEALPLAESILALGTNLCLFDFAGYGNSEGTSVSLGCREIWDIECVLAHLKEHYSQQKFILWGRSMGAVAALLYLATKALLADNKQPMGQVG
jgi:alpha-beta hydrolase superfamily lysophospholipase